MALKALQAWNAKHAVTSKSEEEQERDVQVQLQQLLAERRKAEIASDPTLAAIPRFYFRSAEPAAAAAQSLQSPVGPAAVEGAPEPPSLARQGLLAIARQRLRERKTSQLLDKAQLEKLWDLLSRNVVRVPAAARAAGGVADADAELRIGYEAFVKVAEAMGAGVRETYMRACHFLKFPLDAAGLIAITPFFQWVMRRSTKLALMLELSAYDTQGSGRLSEGQLESYISDLLPSLPALDGLQDSFVPFYVCTAVRKFFFFLDPKRRGTVRVRDMLASPILTELHELRREALSEDETKNNWFSQQTALAVYGEYLQLDTDQNGMLSPSELAHYGGGGLTRPFVENLFAECQTYDGEMDYKTYLDFVLASWYKKTAESLAYFFRLLDVKRKGVLTKFEISYFFRAIVAGSREAGQEPVVLEDVSDEIFDMVKPADPSGITLQDLLDCKVGETIVSMLTDVHGFWAYDNREMLMHNKE